jgi:hypothetical protein
MDPPVRHASNRRLEDLEADADGLTTIGSTNGNLGDAHVVGLATFVRRWQAA